MSTCFVLGAAGFVGSAVVEEAKRRGHTVTEITRANYAEYVGKECDVLINANGNSKKFLAARDPKLEFELSVSSVLKSLHDFPTGRYIHLSTIDVYPNHEDPKANAENAGIAPSILSRYGFHKFCGEQLVYYYAPSWLVLRMAGFVGRGLKKNSIYDLLKNQPLRVHPDSQYQYMNTRALAEILFDLVAKSRANEVFNVAGDGLISLREIAKMIPGYDHKQLKEDLPRERYEVNLAKLKALRAVPPTREAVKEFVEAVRAGKETIS